MMMMVMVMVIVMMIYCTDLPVEWKEKWRTLEESEELHLPPDNTFIGKPSPSMTARLIVLSYSQCASLQKCQHLWCGKFDIGMPE